MSPVQQTAWYDCSIIFPRESYAIGNYTSITVTLLMNKCRIPFAWPISVKFGRMD